MSRNEREALSYSKFKKREMSSFIAQELVYDYIFGYLDDERRRSFEQHLQFSKESQGDLQKVKAGLSYVQILSQSGVSDSLEKSLATVSPQISELLSSKKIRKWYTEIKWGREALVFVLLIGSAIFFAPWGKFLKKSKIIFEEPLYIAKNFEKSKIEYEPLLSGRKQPLAEDEDLQKYSAIKKAENTSLETLNKDRTHKINETLEVLKVRDISSSKQEFSLPQGFPDGISGGFLYRGELSVSNLAVNGFKAREKILKLGGSKAGSVDLGWQKNTESQYYHFSISSNNYNELMVYLKDLGEFRISRESHGRIMKKGTLRMIITINENKK